MKKSVTLVLLCFIVIWRDHRALSSTTTATKTTKTAGECVTNSSWTPRNRYCYLYLAEVANFTQAVESCQRQGAHLVSIGSEEENKFILDLVGTSNLPVWIGLYRSTNDICAGDSCENWMWLDGSELGYSQWATGPFPSPGQCTIMDSRGDWDHYRRCSGELSYVCKQQVQMIPTTTSDGCQSDLSWKPHNQSCYLHLGMKLNFTQANESCEELGAHLVSISSGEENQFIMDFVGKEPAWIGLYRTTNEFCLGEACGHWMWLDGSELGYSQWATGPFPSPGQCTFMNPLGDWYHNTQCSDELGCVCEQKRIFPVTSSGSTTTMRASDMSEIYSSDPVGNAAPTTDSANNDESSLYIGVGVTVSILVIVVVIGLMMYYINTRPFEKKGEADK